ncbi:MAG: polysaccharide biosynthesis C-terminal domain-containing protein [Bacteroidota bacterium]
MKDYSRFYGSLALLIILNVLIKPLWIFGIDRQVQNVVGTAAYGAYFSLFNFSIVLSFLLDWGLTAYYNRQLATGKENFTNKAGNFLFIKLFFAVIYTIVILSVAWLSGIRRWDILWYVIFIQVFTSLFIFFRSIITAQQWFRTDAWLSVLDKTLMIVICGSFLIIPSAFGTMTVERFLQVQATCTGLAMLSAAGIVLRRGISFSVFNNSVLDFKILKPALPFAIIVLLMSVHYRLDGFLLERLHPNGDYEAGLYAGAYRLLDAANMIGFLVASFLLPFLARQWSGKSNIDEVVLISRNLLIIFSLFISSTTIFLAPWIQQLLYHNDNAAAIAVLQYCLPALIGYSLVQVYGTVMTATGHIIQFCYIVLSSVVLNVTLNLLLIPDHGAKGSCMAALISQGYCGAATLVYCRQKLKIPVQFRSLVVYVLLGALLCGFFYFCRSVTFSKWIVVVGAGVICLVVVMAARLFNLAKWKTIFRSNI